MLVLLAEVFAELKPLLHAVQGFRMKNGHHDMEAFRPVSYTHLASVLFLTVSNVIHYGLKLGIVQQDGPGFIIPAIFRNRCV